MDKFFALNQTEADKAAGIMVVDILLDRHGDSTAGATQATVLQQLQIGRPLLASALGYIKTK